MLVFSEPLRTTVYSFFPVEKDLAHPFGLATEVAMHLIDITMFYASESGGVKRYLLAKREWLRRQGGLRHTLLVPGGPLRTFDGPAVSPDEGDFGAFFGDDAGAAIGVAAARLEALAPDLI